MLQHYLLVALRHLRRQKGYAAINVVGLAVGLALCALIGLYVRDELTFDRFHEKADRIVRLTQTRHARPIAAAHEAPPCDSLIMLPRHAVKGRCND